MPVKPYGLFFIPIDSPFTGILWFLHQLNGKRGGSK